MPKKASEAKSSTSEKADSAVTEAPKGGATGQEPTPEETKKASKKTKADVATELLADSQAEATSGTAVVNEAVEETQADQPEPKTAKAGKRSAKALAEAEEKQAKEERKAHKDEEAAETKPKKSVKPARSRLERRGKNYRKASEQIEKGKFYSVDDALELAAKTNPVKFDASVEMHFRLNIDPRQADQNLRDTVVLPGGTGKTVRVAVFADVDDVAAAKKAGADIAAGDEFLQQLDKGTLDFDVLIAPPTHMPKLGKYARLLGPKGLMPNPKSGTVTTAIAKAVKEAKAGKVEYRTDSTGIIHLGIGKVSFGGPKLSENARAVIVSIKANKPSSIKGAYIKSVFVTTAMGPSVPLDINDL